MNIGELYVRLTADAKGVKQGTAEAERSLNSFAGVAARVGGVIAGLFAGQELAQFISSSVQAATAADAVWNRLAGTLRNAGVEFESVRSEIEGMANELENTTKVGDEDFAATLQTLTRITGDYRASLQEVATVADVAAGAQISLETAAQLVGKVMVGETGTLKRYGIVVEEGADAMQLLRDRFRGMAQVEGATLDGQIIRLNNEWGNFKEAIGDALTGGEGMAGVMKRIADFAEAATKEVQLFTANVRALHGWLTRSNALANQFGMGIIGENTGAIRLPGQGAVGPNRAPGTQGLGSMAVAAESAAAASDAARESAQRMEKLVDRMLRDRETARVGRMGNASVDAGLAGSPAYQILRDVSAAAIDLRKRWNILASASSSTAGGNGGSVGPNYEGGNFFSNLFGGLKEQVMGLATSFGPLAAAAAILAPVFNAFKDAVGPALDALILPLRAVGHLLGAVFGKALSFVAEALGLLIRSIGKAINFLVPFANPGNGLVNFGQEMIDAAKAARRGTDAQEEATDSMNKLTESVIGAVNGFKTAGYRHSATIPGGGGGGLGASSVTPPTGSIIVPININSSGDGRETLRNMAVEARRLATGRGPNDPFRIWADSIPVTV